MSFVHLHVHTEYSLLDGACRIEQALDHVKAMGQNALAITDHGVMYGVIDFYKAAKKKGIKPIIGCEVYVAKRSRFDKVHYMDAESRHLVLLCKNEVGYQNLIALVSKSWTEGFYNRPRVDMELLKLHHEGLIALSACLAGEIPRLIVAGDFDGATNVAKQYRDIFGKDNYYLELQDHGIKEQPFVNSHLIRIARELDIPLVATNDSHYIKAEDTKMHHVLVCIQTNKTVDDKNILDFGSDEFYLKSEEQMRELFKNVPEAIENTQKIADRCNLEIEFGKTKLPLFEPETGENSTDYFRRKCFDGLYKKYGENPDPAIVDRLNYELSVIEKMGYVNYYLIVQDYVNYAKNSGVPVGPGRGSGAGSLAAYCIGITGIDPIRYHLLFERFLNPERVSMPDFDIDFSDERRQDVIDYVIRKYGENRVSQIVAFDTMAARASIRDVGRAMALPYGVVDAVAKLIPRVLHVTIDQILAASAGDAEYSAEFKSKYENDPQVHELIDMARKIEGMPRHATTHAAGVVITDVPVSQYVPLARNDEVTVTQYTMTALDELGLIKMDFLGLRNLSVITDAEKLIRRKNPSFTIESIDQDDQKVFSMIAAGHTEGVFQFESPGMKRLLVQSRPKSVEDLIAVISLYRPGPMSFIPTYIENRAHPEKIRYRHPLLKNILDVTYGCIIYQEQVMQICRELAGYSLGRADVVRRAMSKKKADVMEKEKQVFVHGLTDENGNVLVDGCVRRGVDEKTALAIFADMEGFASYAFNKSHAAAYSVVAYETAWLKYYYPAEYMSALLTSVLSETDKVVRYIAECGRLSISVLPPHVNDSKNEFEPEGQNIRFGMLAVKNLGRGLIDAIIKERARAGAFVSFYDFCKRMQSRELNKRALDSLIQCGSLDHLGNNRREMAMAGPMILDHLDSVSRRNLEGQIGFFDMPEFKGSDEFTIAPQPDVTHQEKLSMEKEVTGLYLSGHPLHPYSGAFSKDVVRSNILKEEGEEKYDGKTVTLLGIVNTVDFKPTRNGQRMAFITLEDLYGTIEVLAFPKVLESFPNIAAKEKIVKIRGRVSASENRGVSVVADCLLPLENTEEKPAEKPKKNAKPGLYLKFKKEDSFEYRKAMQYLAIFEGATPLYLYFTDSKSLKAAPPSKRVEINGVLLKQLRALLGEENVVLVE